MTDPRVAAIVALSAVAPIALVVVVALLRGYTITVHLTRDTRERHANRSPSD